MKKIFRCTYKNSLVLSKICPFLTEQETELYTQYPNEISVTTVPSCVAQTLRDMYKRTCNEDVKDMFSKECTMGYTMVTHHAKEKQENFIQYTDAVLVYPIAKHQKISFKQYKYHYFFNKDIWQTSIEETTAGHAKSVVLYNPQADIKTTLPIYTLSYVYDTVR